MGLFLLFLHFKTYHRRGGPRARPCLGLLALHAIVTLFNRCPNSASTKAPMCMATASIIPILRWPRTTSYILGALPSVHPETLTLRKRCVKRVRMQNVNLLINKPYR